MLRERGVRIQYDDVPCMSVPVTTPKGSIGWAKIELSEVPCRTSRGAGRRFIAKTPPPSEQVLLHDKHPVSVDTTQRRKTFKTYICPYTLVLCTSTTLFIIIVVLIVLVITNCRLRPHRHPWSHVYLP